MRAFEPARWDDIVLGVLLLIIGVPRAIGALTHDRPIGVEGTLSLVCVVLALVVLLRRNSRRRPPSTRAHSGTW